MQHSLAAKNKPPSKVSANQWGRKCLQLCARARNWNSHCSNCLSAQLLSKSKFAQETVKMQVLQPAMQKNHLHQVLWPLAVRTRAKPLFCSCGPPKEQFE